MGPCYRGRGAGRSGLIPSLSMLANMPHVCERHERHAQRCVLCAVRDHGGGGVGVSAGKRCTIAS
jgi:hypothetical protein